MDPCPACHCQQPADAHLLREYDDLRRATGDRMFGQHARRVLRQVATALRQRGITKTATIFGPLPIRTDW